MPREIIVIACGQCGNQISNIFWETICGEHNIDQGDGKHENKENEESLVELEKINVYFEETGRRRFVPRSILVDLEPGVLDTLKARKIGKLVSISI